MGHKHNEHYSTLMINQYSKYDFSQKIEPFARSCSAAIRSLQESIDRLKTWVSPDTSQVIPPALWSVHAPWLVPLTDALVGACSLAGSPH